MASGTQGYERTTSSLFDKIIDNLTKKNKASSAAKRGPGPGPAPGPTPSPAQKMLPAASPVAALLPSIVGGAITKYDSEVVEVNVEILEQQRESNRLLVAQTEILKRLEASTSGSALTKVQRAEMQLEEGEDLSDTQGYLKRKRKDKSWWENLLGLVIDAIKALAPVIMKAAALVAAAVAAGKLASALANALRVIPVKVTEIPRAALPPAAAVKGALPPAAAVKALPAAVSPTAKLLPPATTGSALATQAVSGQKALPPGQGQAFRPEVKAQTRALEPLEIGRVDTSKVDPKALRVDGSGESSIDRLLKQAKDQSLGRDAQEQAVAALRRKKVDLDVKPVTPAIPKTPTPDIPRNAASNAAGAMSDAAKLADTGGAAKYLIPGASAISAGLSIMAGDYAGAIVDAADATGDALVVSGATGAAATVGTALSAGAAVIGAGITSSYVGEWTRGVGDWVRGDGNNAALNIVSSITEGLSAALETIGAPFRAIFEFVNSGFNIDKSNEVMAEIDSNIRESARQGLNAIDFLNIIPDEKGAYGTLGLYGDAAKRADAKMRGETVPESGLPQSQGGSYLTTNPSKRGPFLMGESLSGQGAELHTFTPLIGEMKSLKDSVPKHLYAVGQGFMGAVGGIPIAVIGALLNSAGPFGEAIRPSVNKVLQAAGDAFGLASINLPSVSSGTSFDKLIQALGDLFKDVVNGLKEAFMNLVPQALRRFIPEGLRPNTEPVEPVVDVSGITSDSAEEARIAAALVTEGGGGTAATDILQVAANRLAHGGYGSTYTDIFAADRQFQGVFDNPRGGQAGFRRIQSIADAAAWAGVSEDVIKSRIKDMRNAELRADSAEFVGGALEFRAAPSYYKQKGLVRGEMGADGRFYNSTWRGGAGDNQFLKDASKDPMISGPAEVNYDGLTPEAPPISPIITNPKRLQVLLGATPSTLNSIPNYAGEKELKEMLKFQQLMNSLNSAAPNQPAANPYSDPANAFSFTQLNTSDPNTNLYTNFTIQRLIQQ